MARPPLITTQVHRHKETGVRYVDGSHRGGFPEEIDAHLTRYIGRYDYVWHEIVSDAAHIDVLPFPPTPERNFWTFVTCGMSDRPMKVPADYAHEDLRRCELVLSLPADWVDAANPGAFDLGDRWWPIQWLKYLARFPHKYDTWLWADHSVPNGEPAKPLADGTTMMGWMLGPPRTWPRAAIAIDVPRIWFHAIYPLYWHEMDYKLLHGSGALFDLFDQAGVTEVMDPRRPRVV